MSKKYKIAIVDGEKTDIYELQGQLPNTPLRVCNDALMALLRMMHEDRFTYDYAKIYVDSLEKIRKEGCLVQTIDREEFMAHEYTPSRLLSDLGCDSIIFDISFVGIGRKGAPLRDDKEILKYL